MPRRILVVDDSPLVRKYIRGNLQGNHGIEVCGEAIDGLDALEKAKQLSPDVIILDLSMPRMNGLEAARRLKLLVPQTRLILFTLLGDSLRDTDLAAAGFSAMVSKTDGLGVLIKIIHDVFQSERGLPPPPPVRSKAAG